MTNKSDEELVSILWDFNLVLNKPQKSDVLLVFGSHDVSVSHLAVDVYKKGYASLVIFSGGLGRLTDGKWTKSEASVFAQEAVKRGLPEDAYLLEEKSKNSGENVTESMQLLRDNNVQVSSVLIAQKPYMLQRAIATFKKHEPKIEVSAVCVSQSFDEYISSYSFSKNETINIVVGDIQRLKEYSLNGFQVPVSIPDDVWMAFEELVSRGYIDHSVSDQLQ